MCFSRRRKRARHRFAELELPVSSTEFCEPVAGDGQHAVQRRVEHPLLTAGDVNDHSMWSHTFFVARFGFQAHRLAAQRMGWCCGA